MARLLQALSVARMAYRLLKDADDASAQQLVLGVRRKGHSDTVIQVSSQECARFLWLQDDADYDLFRVKPCDIEFTKHKQGQGYVALIVKVNYNDVECPRLNTGRPHHVSLFEFGDLDARDIEGLRRELCHLFFTEYAEAVFYITGKLARRPQVYQTALATEFPRHLTDKLQRIRQHYDASWHKNCFNGDRLHVAL